MYVSIIFLRNILSCDTKSGKLQNGKLERYANLYNHRNQPCESQCNIFPLSKYIHRKIKKKISSRIHISENTF